MSKPIVKKSSLVKKSLVFITDTNDWYLTYLIAGPLNKTHNIFGVVKRDALFADIVLSRPNELLFSKMSEGDTIIIMVGNNDVTKGDCKTLVRGLTLFAKKYPTPKKIVVSILIRYSLNDKITLQITLLNNKIKNATKRCKNTEFCSLDKIVKTVPVWHHIQLEDDEKKAIDEKIVKLVMFVTDFEQPKTSMRQKDFKCLVTIPLNKLSNKSLIIARNNLKLIISVPLTLAMTVLDKYIKLNFDNTDTDFTNINKNLETTEIEKISSENVTTEIENQHQTINAENATSDSQYQTINMENVTLESFLINFDPSSSDYILPPDFEQIITENVTLDLRTEHYTTDPVPQQQNEIPITNYLNEFNLINLEDLTQPIIKNDLNLPTDTNPQITTDLSLSSLSEPTLSLTLTTSNKKNKKTPYKKTTAAKHLRCIKKMIMDLKDFKFFVNVYNSLLKVEHEILNVYTDSDRLFIKKRIERFGKNVRKMPS